MATAVEFTLRGLSEGAGSETFAVRLPGPVAAREAGLRYVRDDVPGIRRRKSGKGFSYRWPDDERVTDRATLARIRKLAIPPAWTDVWICPLASGHIQATARDAKGRKQYRYHSRWQEFRDSNKYDRMIAFGEALPGIRERVARDLSLPGLCRERVMATVVRLLETTLIRIGNDEYARENSSYGLTTLRCRHVEVEGATLRFHFRGKSGKMHDLAVRDRRVARIVRRCQELPGQDLFQYLDAEGQRRTVSSTEVNAYLREISGQDFTAKDFRTWGGSVLAFKTLLGCGPAGCPTEAKKSIVETIKTVSQRLGNTPAVCRKCYVHPAVLDAYLAGTLIAAPGEELPGLQPEEAGLLAFLKTHRDRAAAAEPSLLAA